MLSVRTIAKYSTPKRIGKSNRVKIKLTGAFAGKDRHGYFKMFRGVARDPVFSRRKHTWTIKRYGFGATAEVKLLCDCEDFKYRWEVALTRQKSSVKCFSNGKLPKKTNPHCIPAACKHLIAALKATARLSPTNPDKFFTPRGF